MISNCAEYYIYIYIYIYIICVYIRIPGDDDIVNSAVDEDEVLQGFDVVFVLWVFNLRGESERISYIYAHRQPTSNAVPYTDM